MGISRKNYIKGGIVAALIIGEASYKIFHRQNAETPVQQISTLEELSLSEKLKIPEKVFITDLIKRVTLENCLNFVETYQNNSPIAGQINKHGLQKTGEHRAKLEFYSIDLAKEYASSDLIIPEQKYKEIAKQRGIDEDNFYKGFSDQRAKNVEKARIKIIQLTTRHYKKIISQNRDIKFDNNKTTEKYHELIRKAFTEKEYAEYCNKWLKARSDYITKIEATLSEFIMNMGGRESLETSRKADKEYLDEMKNRIYNK